MSEAIRCKRIIEGRTYNTETSTLLGRWEPSDDSPLEHALFKTRHGAYFLHTLAKWSLEEFVEPKEPEDAQRLMEQNCSAERVEAEFGEMPEAGDPEARITLRIPESLRRRAVPLAEARKQSLNAWLLRCIERAVTDEETANG